MFTALGLGLGVAFAGAAAHADDPASQGSATDRTETGKYQSMSRIHFDFDSAELTDEGRKALDEAASWIQKNEADTILIEGHTDAVGQPPYNKDLAERRAEAARSYLQSRGVDASKIRVLSYGQGLPAEEASGRSRENRRVVVMAVQKEPIVETQTVTRDVERVVDRPVDRTVYVDREVPVGREPLGFEVMAGGGVTGFIDDFTRDLTGTGGAWSARVVGGRDSWIGYELAYVGSLQSIDALGLDSNATVLGNGAEGDLRLNLVRGRALQPYIFAGLGWTHYRVVNTESVTASINRSDEVLHIPGGVGLNLRLMDRFSLDLRGTVRGALHDGMFHGDDGAIPGESGGLESWATTAQIGVAF